MPGPCAGLFTAVRVTADALRMNRFDYRLIRQYLIFSIVAEEKSFSRAAKRLFMTQSPLIAQINELEDRLHVKLIERSPRGVTVTPVGESLLPAIRKLVGHAETIDHSLRLVREETREFITIGAVNEAMVSIIPPFLKKLQEISPETAVYTKEILSSDAEEKLLSQEIDLAISYKADYTSPDIESKVLRQMRPMVAVSELNPLAARESVSWSDLVDVPLIVLRRESSPCYWDQVMECCRRNGLEPRVQNEVETTALKICYVSCNQGVAIIPEPVKAVMPPNVRVIPIRNTGEDLRLYAAWHGKNWADEHEELFKSLAWKLLSYPLYLEPEAGR